MKQYKIGDLKIGLLEKDISLAEDRILELFRADCGSSEMNFLFYMVTMKFQWFHDAKQIKKTGRYELLETQRGLFLLCHWASCRFAYGLFLDDLYLLSRIPVYVNPDMQKEISLDCNRFLASAGLHSVLLQKGAPVLHASYIAYANKAILFTAPSQTGKSTQAGLWETFAKAEIINGDRTLVRRTQHRWYAYGYPSCGSSGICVNRTLEIAMLAVLEQGDENRIEMLSPMQKIRALAAATEVFLWERREIEWAFCLAQQIADEVPMIKLTCLPNEHAVSILKEYMEVNGYVDHI